MYTNTVERYWYSILGTVLLLQYCGLTISWRLEQVLVTYHFLTLRNKAICFNLVTVLGSAKINIYSLIVYLCMHTCKSYFFKKEIIFCIVYTSRNYYIQKIRRYQKLELRYNYTTGVLLNIRYKHLLQVSMKLHFF